MASIRWRHAARVVLVAAVILSGFACADEADRDPGPATLEGFDFTPDATVTVDEGGFSPALTTVRSGDVIAFVNRGTSDHSFTDPERFDTGLLRPGEQVTVVLHEPGDIDFADLARPDHGARLVVRPAPTG